MHRCHRRRIPRPKMDPPVSILGAASFPKEGARGQDRSEAASFPEGMAVTHQHRHTPKNPYNFCQYFGSRVFSSCSTYIHQRSLPLPPLKPFLLTITHWPWRYTIAHQTARVEPYRVPAQKMGHSTSRIVRLESSKRCPTQDRAPGTPSRLQAGRMDCYFLNVSFAFWLCAAAVPECLLHGRAQVARSPKQNNIVW